LGRAVANAIAEPVAEIVQALLAQGGSR
jgi:hypothetical protein